MTEEAIFRSAKMVLVQVYMASEIARDCVWVLGEMGSIEFLDLNEGVNSFQRAFVEETRRLDNTERQLRYLEGVMREQGVEEPREAYGGAYGGAVRQPSRDLEELMRRTPQTTSEMDAVVKAVAEYEQSVREMAETYRGLEKRQQGLQEERSVLEGTRKYFETRMSYDGYRDEDEGSGDRDSDRSSVESSDRFTISSNDSLLTQEERADGFGPGDVGLHDLEAGPSTRAGAMPRESSVNILGTPMGVVCGTIETDKFAILERILWRTLRGNLYVARVEIGAPVVDFDTGEEQRRCIFAVFTHGGGLVARSRAVAESLGGRVVDVPGSHQAYAVAVHGVNGKLADVQRVLAGTAERLAVELKEVAGQLARWRAAVARDKAVYAAMNRFDYDPARRCLVAEGWMPRGDVGTARAALVDVADRRGVDIAPVVSVVDSHLTPPTFFRTNKFTAAFQAIVDAYGIASYREINPGLPAIVTFPFMFAIMFGDMGHGLILTLAAASLCLAESAIARQPHRGEIFDMAYSGRYVLLLMGLFSIFTGFLYSDLFSRPITLFASRWAYPAGFKEGQTVSATQTGVYPIGLDWAWHAAENTLLFANSYKMKLSILMGFIHMSYSLQLSLANFRFFRSRVDIIGNYIPGFLFMHCIFGYLCLTIVYKWCVDWIGLKRVAPSLLNMLINMFLAPGTVDHQLYPGQGPVQLVLLAVALVCVPWLLLYKPLALRRAHNHSVALGYSEVLSGPSEASSLASSHSHYSPLRPSESESHALSPSNSHSSSFSHPPPPPFNFSDIMVNQVIYTIEFCLNCVSHTASYLRLWALSLAHNQLSSVLWNMTLRNSFVAYPERGFWGCIIVVLLFALWFVLTVAVLVCMEGTSAMLHSLRLHWVEAMSKHFQGEGYKYTPFSFYRLLTSDDDS